MRGTETGGDVVIIEFPSGNGGNGGGGGSGGGGGYEKQGVL